MNRRDLLIQGMGISSVAGVAALMQVTDAFAGDASKAAPAAASSALAKVLETSSRCVTTGLVCIKHCQKELLAGNKMMAECLQSVLELVSSCENLMTLVALESVYAKDFAKLTAKVCSDCGKICEKHAKHMEACKACMEACRECEKACLAL
jgi:Cys-rich four helix bundle protein (predicted Tat secretion target)